MKKNINIIITVSILIAVIIALILVYINQSNLVKLDYDEIIEKMNNKEDFILCISASDCIHCKSYKPKLKKISNDYDITIYYINIDTLTDEEYSEIKAKLNFDGGTPVTIFIKSGIETTTANRINGDTSTDKIISKFKSTGFIK